MHSVPVNVVRCHQLPGNHIHSLTTQKNLGTLALQNGPLEKGKVTRAPEQIGSMVGGTEWGQEKSMRDKED